MKAFHLNASSFSSNHVPILSANVTFICDVIEMRMDDVLTSDVNVSTDGYC